MVTLEELRADQSIDTVIMAFTDMQGRLLGKRLHRDFFFEQVDHGHGTEGCNYLLALDMEMEPTPGYEIASWERGYGDFDLVPDLATLRRLPVARGDGSRAVRRAVARRIARAAVAAAGAAGAARACRDARLRRAWSARSSSSISCARPTRRRTARATST